MSGIYPPKRSDHKHKHPAIKLQEASADAPNEAQDEGEVEGDDEEKG